MNYIFEFANSLLGEKCANTLLIENNFSDQDCTSLALSKLIGSSIVIGASLVKFPQILKILSAKSSVGLSMLALYADIIVYILTWSYSTSSGFPFSTWGESMFLTIQDFIIIMLCFYYRNEFKGLVIFTIAVSSILGLLLSGLIPHSVFLYSQSMCVLPLMLFSKGKQIQVNFSAGSTGQLSFITIYLLWQGTIGRMFTTLRETKDSITVVNYSFALALNSLLLLQILWYWRATDSKNKEE